MLISKQILVRAFVLAICVLNLAACGQTGALYLPAKTSPQSSSSAPTTP
ncbi:LPS translocon maturation chaperone LptM [Rhodoferax saidenbachensis]|nr:lipoprotein [Rhodoferax saidenbachensis]